MDAISFFFEIAPIMDQLFPHLQPAFRLRSMYLKYLAWRINGDDWKTVERTATVTLGPVPNIQLGGKQVANDDGSSQQSATPQPVSPVVVNNYYYIINQCTCPHRKFHHHDGPSLPEGNTYGDP